VKTWTDGPKTLTDEQIIRATMTTFRYWHPLLGVNIASNIAAARMKRLMQRSGGAS
jgi:hypothetical protein